MRTLLNVATVLVGTVTYWQIWAAPGLADRRDNVDPTTADLPKRALSSPESAASRSVESSAASRHWPARIARYW